MKTGNSAIEKILNISFVVFICLLVFTRVYVYIHYNLEVIDSDQPFMWAGANDFLHGCFKEPRYYGQAYNTFMEALFAVPLLWCHLPVYKAVPLATHFISLFPYLFIAGYLFAKNKKVHALLVLAYLLCLPAPADLLNGLPRGFVTGLFFTSFFIINLFHPEKLLWLGINTALALLGYYVNPNSALVSAPFLFYMFLHHFKNSKYYWLTGSVMLLAIPLHLFFNQFYIKHPDYIINPIEYRLSTDLFVTNISNLDQRFTHISPFFENNSLLLLFLLAFMIFYFFKQNKKALYAMLVLLGILLFSFCMGKTQEGSTWVFISFSRFYLGIPLLICLFGTLIEFKFHKLALSLLLVPIIFDAYKINTMQDKLAWHFEERYWVGPHLFKLNNILKDMDFYNKVCHNNQSPFLLISSGFWLCNALDYGGQAVYPDFPASAETLLEKRYWVRNALRDSVIKQFVIISKNFILDKQVPVSANYELQKIDDYGLVLVKNNKLKMRAFMDSVMVYD